MTDFEQWIKNLIKDCKKQKAESDFIGHTQYYEGQIFAFKVCLQGLKDKKVVDTGDLDTFWNTITEFIPFHIKKEIRCKFNNLKDKQK